MENILPHGVESLRDLRISARAGLQKSGIIPKSVRRLGFCGRVARAGEDFISIRAVKVEDRLVGGFAGYQTCGSVWACPCCSAKILAARQVELENGINNWALKGGSVAMFTYTMRHKASQSLEDLWNALGEAWNSVTGGKVHQAEKKLFGVEVDYVVKSGKNAGRTKKVFRLPHIRLTEVTHGVNGWHVHLHVLVFLSSAMTRSKAQELYNGMWSRWNSGLVSAGVLGSKQVNEIRFLDSKTALSTKQFLSGYFSKNTYGSGLAAEATRSDYKRGYGGSLSPFEMLAQLTHGLGDLDLEVLQARYQEFLRVSKGRRQMTFGAQTREILELGESKTDEELADVTLGTFEDEIVCVSTQEAKRMDSTPGLKLAVLRVIEAAPSKPEAASAVYELLRSNDVLALPSRALAEVPVPLEYDVARLDELQRYGM